jgi:signal transduction histidine kinase
MPSTEWSVSQRTRSAMGHLLIVGEESEEASDDSIEIASEALSAGCTTSRAASFAGALEAVVRECPDAIVMTDRVFANAADFRAVAAERGIPVLVVVDDPLAPADSLAEADDWVARKSLARELYPRLTRLLKRGGSGETHPSEAQTVALPADPKFFGLVIHDLRTPLNVIGLSLRMISQAIPQGDPDLDEDVRFVEENFRQLERMLALLSDYYRLFENEAHFAPTAFNPRRLIDELVESRGAKAGAKASPVRIEIDPSCPSEVALDPLRARLAIQYVLVNTTAAAGGVPIRLSVRGGPERWVTEVAIDHPSPASVNSFALLPRTFERLFGVAQERRGMDLAIAAKVSQIFGGTARLDVLENRATSIVLDWPARHALA